MNKKEAEKLLEKYHQGLASPEETLLLELWYLKKTDRGILLLAEEENRIKREIWTNLTNDSLRKRDRVLVYKIVAAASILVSLTFAFLFYQNSSNEENEIVLTALVQPDDLMPGSNRATLTFSDGNSIDLNQEQDGIVVQAGEISYQDGTFISTLEETEFALLSTPNGGQYQIVLPDGTKVWLNAASSLKYPKQFSGEVRRVELTGEGYFEVAQVTGENKKQQRFVVKTASQEVEVLGTHFNINSYLDESAAKTTLIEGAVKVFALKDGFLTSDQGIILVPNQQSSLKRNDSEFQVNTIDPSATMAWKEGLFQFDHADIETVMRQLARWYDVEVVYEGKMPKGVFTGKVYRNMKASSVLDGLSSLGVKFRIEGNKIIVVQS